MTIVNTSSVNAYEPSEDIIDDAWLLASNDSSYATGQVYGAEGGKGWP